MTTKVQSLIGFFRLNSLSGGHIALDFTKVIVTHYQGYQLDVKVVMNLLNQYLTWQGLLFFSSFVDRRVNLSLMLPLASE